MNAEEASLLWNRKDEVDQIGGSAAHRQLALKHLKLKTIIKVSPLSAASPNMLRLAWVPIGMLGLVYALLIIH